MAIQMSTNFRGINIKDAYIKIKSLSIDNDLKIAGGVLEMKVDEDSPGMPFDPMPTFSSVPFDEGSDHIEQLYNYLMTLDVFSGSVKI